MLILILILQVLILNFVFRHGCKAIAAHDELVAHIQALEAYVGPESHKHD